MGEIFYSIITKTYSFRSFPTKPRINKLLPLLSPPQCKIHSETGTESESESEQHSTVTTAASVLPKTKNKRLSEEATTTSVKVKRAKVETDLVMNSFVFGSLASFGVSEEYVKKRWSLVPVEVKKKIEERFKALKRKEMEFVVLKTGFVSEVVHTLFAEDAISHFAFPTFMTLWFVFWFILSWIFAFMIKTLWISIG